MRSGLGVTATAAVLLVTLAAPAGGAWTAPAELPGTAGRYPLLAAYGPDAAITIGMFGPLALFPASPQVPISTSRLLAGATPGAPAVLPGGLATPIAISPGGTMLAVAGPRSPLDYFGLEGGRGARLRVAIGPLGGGLKRIATGSVLATKTLASAVNDRGDGAVVSSRCIDTQCEKRSVLATFRRRGHPFTTPLVLATRTGQARAAVTLNARGDALVAWTQTRAVTVESGSEDIRARVRHADGTLTKVRTAGPTWPRPTITATLSRGRHGTVAWFNEGVAEGGDGGPFIISESEIDSRGTIGARNILDSGEPIGHGDSDAVSGSRLQVVVGPDGVPTFAYTGFADGHYVVRATRLHRDVEDTQTLSPPGADARLMDLEADAAGDVLAVWTSVPGTTSTPGVVAVVRRAGSTVFGAPELVLSGADSSGTAVGAIASGDRAVVAGGPEVAGGVTHPPSIHLTQLLG